MMTSVLCLLSMVILLPAHEFPQTDWRLQERYQDLQGSSTVAQLMTSALFCLHSHAEPQKPFAIYTGAVELRNTLAAQYGVQLPQTVTFDYPTIPALAGYIAAHMAPSSAGADPLPEQVLQAPEPSQAISLYDIRQALVASSRAHQTQP